jgi:phosphatidate cytidylyltransferase
MHELPGDAAARRAPRTPSNFALRVASALVLASVTIALDYWGLVPFSLTVLAVVLAMSWEWGRIVRGAGFDPTFAVHAVAAGAAVVLGGLGQAGLGLLALLIGTLILLVRDMSRDGVVSALGIPYVGLPALALLFLRSDAVFGFQATIFVLLVVWAMDTFALLGGRNIGGPKLWPRVSPNKTWAGLLSGAAAGALAGFVFAKVIGAPALALSALSLVLALVSQAGDLAESALKRLYGVKDSSGLIPGHGGFLDRVDGVVAAAVAAAVIALAVNAAAPGRALLLGH